MPKIQSHSAESIQKALEGNKRQYLVGNLQMPQALAAIPDPHIEVGFSSYAEDKAEITHYHTEVTEYQYVLKGLTEYMDVETREVYRFKTGDFFVTYPGTTYAQRVKAGTDILFFKCPGKNDKVVVENPKDVAAWLVAPWD